MILVKDYSSRKGGVRLEADHQLESFHWGSREKWCRSGQDWQSERREGHEFKMCWGRTWRPFWRAGQVKRGRTSRLMSHATQRTVLSFTREAIFWVHFGPAGGSEAWSGRGRRAGGHSVCGRENWPEWHLELEPFCSHFSSIKTGFNMSSHTPNKQKPTPSMQIHFPETSMKHMDLLTRFCERDDGVFYTSRSSF